MSRDTLDVQVEQAIARGEDTDTIVRKLGVSQRFVRTVWLRLETLNCEIDAPQKIDGEPVRHTIGHGDHAGFNAHRDRGETPCDACYRGEREYQRDYKRRWRARRRAA